MELKKFETLVVSSIDGHCDGPTEVARLGNVASGVMVEDSGARQNRVMRAVLNHCKASKEQNAALKLG